MEQEFAQTDKSIPDQRIPRKTSPGNIPSPFCEVGNFPDPKFGNGIFPAEWKRCSHISTGLAFAYFLGIPDKLLVPKKMG